MAVSLYIAINTARELKREVSFLSNFIVEA